MKILHIGSKLICMAGVFTLNAVQFECAFSQSTSISGLGQFEGEFHHDMR